MLRLHFYLTYSNGKCDNLMQNISIFATEQEYGQYFDGHPQGHSASKYQSSLENIIEATKSQLDDIIKVVVSIGSDSPSTKTDEAFELAEVKRIKIAAKILSTVASIKEIQLGIRAESELAEIKDDFMKNVVEAVEDLFDHVSNVFKLDDVFTQIIEKIVYVGQAQQGLARSLAFSFLS